MSCVPNPKICRGTPILYYLVSQHNYMCATPNRYRREGIPTRIIEFNSTSAYPPLSLGEVMCFDVTCDVIAVCAWYCVYTYICIHIIRASKAHRPIGIWSGCMYANRQCGAVLCLPPSHKKGSAPAPGRRRKVNKDEPKGKSGQQSKQWSLSFKFVVPPHHQAQSKYGTRGLDFTSPR